MTGDLPDLPDLPHGLAPPLHLLEPWWRRPETWGWALALLLLLALALWTWRRWRRWRRMRLAELDAGPAPTATPVRRSRWLTEVNRIWQEHREGGDLRRGLAELSRLLRDHFAARLPGVSSHPGLTAGEVARQAHGEVFLLLSLVSLHQFGRREPQQQDFDDICRMAVEVLERGEDAAGEAPSAAAKSGRRHAGAPREGSP